MARDGEIYKDKIEVSLDARQIFYLFFGGSVVVGLVFVLGVMVGRRVEARGFAERAHLEATLDPLAALDRLEGSGALSFAATLSGESLATPVDKAVNAQMALAKQADVAPSKAAAKPEAKDVKPEAKPEAKDMKPDAKPEAKDAKLDAKDAKPEAKDAKSDAKPDAKDAKVEAKAEAKDAKPEDKPEKKSRYTLQLSSFQDRGEAEAFAQSVKTTGFSPYVIQGEVDSKQFYRVRIGSYRSLDAANDAKADFEKATKKSAIVTKL